MRTALWIGVLVVPTLAFGRTSVRVGGLHGGGRPRGGLSIHYGHTGDHSSFSLRFGGGSRWGGSRGPYRGAYPGSAYLGSAGYSYPGVRVYRGWVPYPPGWYYSNVPYRPDRAVGPFAYVDAVQFVGGGGVQVFGPAPEAAVAAGPAPPGPPRAPRPAPAAYARLSSAQLIDRGDDLFGRGRFADAVVAYGAAAAKSPKDPMAAYALGHGLFAAGDHGGAAAALRRGLQLYPGLLAVRMNRRDFYGDRSVFDAQLARLERHVAASPGDAAARFVLGYNYWFTQQRAKAREQFAALGRGDREAQLVLAEMDRRR